MPRGRPGHRPQNTVKTFSELRVRTVFMCFILPIISIYICSNFHICRSPREIIIEQGLHPNPGPGSGMRRITMKTKPEDARRAAKKTIEDEKKKEHVETVVPQYSPLITEGKREFSNREGGEEAIYGGREPGHTENTPNNKSRPNPETEKHEKLQKGHPKHWDVWGRVAPPH